MGAARDFITATVADAIAPTFRRPVEDIIYETLDRRQVPNRSDFREIRDLVNGLRGQVTGAIQSSKQMAETIDSLEADLAECQRQLEESNKELQSLKAQAESASSSQMPDPDLLRQLIEEAMVNMEQGSKNLQGCKVPDCETKARARGFCQRHYQQWRRHTLEHFVSLEGDIHHEGEVIHVGEAHSGELYSTEGSDFLIGKEIVGSTK
jgi:hypothetical protein